MPRISPFDFGDDDIYEGQAAQLACMVPVGDTPIEINWTLNGKALSPSLPHNIGKLGPRTSILLIDPVTLQHSGTWACSVSNPSGKTEFESTLQVHG